MDSDAAARFSRATRCGAGNGKLDSNGCVDIFRPILALAIDYLILRPGWIMTGAQFSTGRRNGVVAAAGAELKCGTK